MSGCKRKEVMHSEYRDADVDVNGDENAHITREELKWWQICVQWRCSNENPFAHVYACLAFYCYYIPMLGSCKLCTMKGSLIRLIQCFYDLKLDTMKASSNFLDQTSPKISQRQRCSPVRWEALRIQSVALFTPPGCGQSLDPAW
ncbi:hypothetical protein CAPTEDRAFT_217447 [Capitella teleta]|uniref:Uncharacterized protein n=1 Tax=Capitella teleta TaxID=283909 RepID=R7UTU1_CAPTE|nr:hypothetical protein CAPTEDRAFT_217447 [Capitella teleta]|eukprot:ELU06826.1 hypothetical protein CAPTEDRAFT_217447 [Capitella teleta]